MNRWGPAHRVGERATRGAGRPASTGATPQTLGEQRVAVLRPLALIDAEGHALAVDVAHFEPCDLADPEAGAVGRHQEHAVLDVRRDREEPLDLLAAQDLGQPLGHFGARQTELRLTLSECDAIEKPQAIGDEVAGAVGEPPLLQEVQEVALHLLDGDPIGTPPIELRQAPHRLDIRLPGTDRHPPQDHIVFHLLP